LKLSLTNHDNYNCCATTQQGQQYLLYANWLHNNGLDHWQGWHCQAGTKRLHIDKNLQVYSGECLNDHLGSALDGFDLLDDGTVCQRPRCTACTDDLLVEKHSRDNNV
jgi:hypothetical protein